MSKYDISGKTVYDVGTGEIIDLKEIKRVKQTKVMKEFRKNMQELAELGIEPDLFILEHRNKKYDCINVKREFEFNKVFSVQAREILEGNKLSKNARCFIGTFCGSISFPDNSIVVRYENPAFEDMMKILDMSKSVLQNTLKELEYNDIVKRKRVNGQYIVYFNPFLFIAGKCVEKDTYLLFVSSIYNPANLK